MPLELFWLTLTALMTSLFWVPYVLNRMAVRGIGGTLANPKADAQPLSDWAERAAAAHRNAVENLAIFAPLAIAVHVLEMGSDLTTFACMAFFIARAAHFVIYAAGIPVARTLAFTVGWLVQVLLALRLLGLV